MLYIIQLDNSGYVAHDNQSGWFVTSEKDKACKLGIFWIKKMTNTFDENLEKLGYINIKSYFKHKNYSTNITNYNSKKISYKNVQPNFLAIFKEVKTS